MEIKRHIDREIAQGRLVDINEQVEVALLFMEAAASDWRNRYYREIAAGNTPFANWNEFSQAFRLSFEPIQDEQGAITELINYSQGKQSVAEYHAHFD